MLGSTSLRARPTRPIAPSGVGSSSLSWSKAFSADPEGLNENVPLMPTTRADFFPSLDRMTENWELKALERRLDSIEKGLERDREKAREEKDQSREERRRRSERWTYVSGAVCWTIYVVAMTTYVVLAATGNLHHH